MNGTIKSFAELVFTTPADGLMLCDASLNVSLVDRRVPAFFGWKDEYFSKKPLIKFFDLNEESVLNALYTDLKSIHIPGVSAKTAERGNCRVDLTCQFIRGENSDCEVLLSYIRRVPPAFSRFMERAIFQMPLGIFQASRSMHLTFANEAMCRMFQYDSLEEIEGVAVRQLLAGEDVHHLLSLGLSGPDWAQGRRVLLKRRDGTNFWGQLNFLPDEYNGFAWFTGMVADVTELVEGENLLTERSNMLYRTSWELDKFIYQVSHDLRSPISSMEGLINLIRLEGNEHKYVTMLGECLARLNSFIGQLTSFAKNMRQRIKDDRVDFKAIVSSILNDLQAHRYFERIEIGSDLNLTCLFFSDSFRITLLLSNILRNAYDFHDMSKSMRVINISIDTSSEKAVIEIFDNGSGIPKAHLDRVFDMFFRASEDSKGSGIGLYIAKEAVRVLGGTISLKSEFGIGTSVLIELPNSDKGRLIGLKNARRQIVKKRAKGF